MYAARGPSPSPRPPFKPLASLPATRSTPGPPVPAPCPAPTPQINGLRIWATNEYKHSGIRDDGARILDRLLGMARDMIPLE